MDIVVENLSKSFGPQKAIDSISFQVKRGEVLGFLGPNGAGKTTTMKIISCFLFPDAGNVQVGNYSIRKHAAQIRQHIGYLPEHNPLYDEMNVIDFLQFIARIHNIPRYRITARILDMLRLCGLEKEKYKNIRELSKGYKQRVGLAQALIHDPEVVLLDEPTTGLDPNQIVEIREMIRTIGREKTIIFSSHLLTQVEATCNRVLIIHKGKIAADGTSAELRLTYTEKLLRLVVEGGNTEAVFNLLTGIPDVEDVEITEENSFRIQAGRNAPVEKDIFQLCEANGWYIKELVPIEERLEDIFRQVTQSS
ncbi:MAG: ATP-binding cassette domain-containing protein [Culturomica sp.]|jgi:ABC-2 type transport system ATP-binding protein|nr:ATP-binding cassette domain-containing protein [Culturomica sp.]